MVLQSVYIAQNDSEKEMREESYESIKFSPFSTS